jgi:hypothetical protein
MDYGHCNTHRTDCSLSFAQTWEVDTRLFFSAKVRSCASTQTFYNSRCGKSITDVCFPGRVGKTSILLRYIRGEYDDKQVSTLQASFLEKKIAVNNKVRIESNEVAAS